jgi:hypothetical protein
MELLRQQYAYFLANSTNNQNYLSPTTYECLMAQKVLAQQFIDNYRTLIEQQYQNQQCGYPVVEGIYCISRITSINSSFFFIQINNTDQT